MQKYSITSLSRCVNCIFAREFKTNFPFGEFKLESKLSVTLLNGFIWHKIKFLAQFTTQKKNI